MALVTAIEIVNQGIAKAAPINDRFDASLIAPFIDVSEYRYFLSFICEDFYNDLVSQKDGIGQYNSDLGAVTPAYTVNSNYEYLYKNYVLPYISYCVIHQSLPFINTQLSSRGLMIASSDFAHNVGRITTKDNIHFIQDELMQIIKVLKNRLLDYLCENKAVYTLFCSGDCPNENCDDSDAALTNDLGIIFY